MSVILTRYLYIQQDVMASLFQSIHEKKKEEALFWAYELYYSGFEEHVASFLSTIYHQSFWSLEPKLKKYIDKMANGLYYTTGVRWEYGGKYVLACT